MEFDPLLSLGWNVLKLIQGHKKGEAQEAMKERLDEQFKLTLTLIRGLVEIVKSGASEVQLTQIGKLEELLQTAANEAKSDDDDEWDEDDDDEDDDEDDLDDDDWEDDDDVDEGKPIKE